MAAGIGTLAVSEGCKQRIRELLKTTLAGKEDTERALLKTLNELGDGKEEFDKEGSQYAEECRGIIDRIERNSRDIKKIKDGLRSLDNSTFTGICNKCERPIPEEELLGNPNSNPPIPASPTRKLCSSCQAEINNR